MASLLDGLMEQLAGGGIEQISSKLGVDSGTGNSAIAAALPAILAGLARNAQKPGGAEALQAAIAKDHDGSVLDDVPGYLESTDSAQGGKILGHVFGEQKPAVEAQVSQLSGLGGAGGGQLMEMLAPLVMGMLGKQAGGLDASALSKMLGSQDLQGMLQGGLGDMLGGMMGGGAAKSGASGTKGAGNIIGMLGKMFGRRR